MKISTRLSLSFSAISSFIFILFSIGVYLFSSNYRSNDFKNRLEERVLVSEKIFLEKESFSPIELEKITNQFLHKLPQETEEMVSADLSKTVVFKYDYPTRTKKEIITAKAHYFEDHDRQGMSKRFYVNGKNYLIIVAATDKVGLQNLTYLRGRIILLILIGIPLIFIGGFVITNRALRPLSNKIAHANNIGASNLDQRLKVYNPNDEIGKLAIAFNKLLDRLEESFKAQKGFISSASHEMKNPLTAIMGEAEVTLNQTRTATEYQAALDRILIEAEKLNSTTNNLLQLSKVTAEDKNFMLESMDFISFLVEIKASFDFSNPRNKIKLEFNNAVLKQLTIRANKELMKTAILNLFDNACKFSFDQLVNVSIIELERQVVVTIVDRGIGITKADLDKIILPFHRGNNALKISGSGIGLSLSSRIIDLHDGILVIESTIDLGTTVTVKLPLEISK